MLKQLQKLAKAFQQMGLFFPELDGIIRYAQDIDEEDEDNFQIGDEVVISGGKYKSMSGTISNINHSNNTAVVTINMFGRPVPHNIGLNDIYLKEKGPPAPKFNDKADLANIDYEMAKNEPLRFLKNYGLRLDELDERGVSAFEYALQTVMEKEIRTSNKTAQTHLIWSNILVPIFTKYPEYSAVLTPEEIVSPIIIHQDPVMTQFISDDQLREAFLKMEQDREYGIKNLISEFFQELGLPKFGEKTTNFFKTYYPNSMKFIYDYMLANYPILFFEFQKTIDKVFDYDDAEEAAYRVLTTDPGTFLSLGLDKKYPDLSQIAPDAYPGSKSTEQIAVEAMLTPRHSEGEVQQDNNNALLFEDIRDLLNKKYYEKYPDILKRMFNLLITNSNLLYSLSFYYVREYEVETPDPVVKDLLEDVSHYLIYEERYEEFFRNNMLPAMFKDLGFATAKKIKNEKPQLFEELGLKWKFPKLRFDVGQEIQIVGHLHHDGEIGTITQIDETSGDITVRLNKGQTLTVGPSDISEYNPEDWNA